MMAPTSTLRRAYDTAAILAILHLVALGGLVAYALGSGAVDGEKLRQVASVLRGGTGAATVVKPDVQSDNPEQEQSAPVRGTNAVAEAQMDLEIVRRESERIKTELDQRLALNNTILLRVTAERERFRRERDEREKEQLKSTKQRGAEGFRKQIAIYESLSPKVAIQHLLSMADPEEAARVLLEINTRKAKAIVEAAKRGDQFEKMKGILQRVRLAEPDRPAELDGSDR